MLMSKLEFFLGATLFLPVCSIYGFPITVALVKSPAVCVVNVLFGISLGLVNA